MRDQTQGSFHSEPACYLLFEDGMFISDAEYALKKYLATSNPHINVSKQFCLEAP